MRDRLLVKRTNAASAMLWLSGLVLLATPTSSSQVISSTPEIKTPNLDLILQRTEDVQHQDPAKSRPYQVTREYKVFRGCDKEPFSEVIAEIDSVPPDMRTYKIVQTKGNLLGERVVRELIGNETESARIEQSAEISRANYDFVFLRRQNFGVEPEYVFAIFPKRKDKFLLLGQIWVDASSFRIRRIEGVPAKSSSYWLKSLHITLQFAELGGMWVPVSFDGIATLRLFGEYTLAGLNTRTSEPLPAAPK